MKSLAITTTALSTVGFDGCMYITRHEKPGQSLPLRGLVVDVQAFMSAVGGGRVGYDGLTLLLGPRSLRWYITHQTLVLSGCVACRQGGKHVLHASLATRQHFAVQ
jgi:hypothetical protein